MNEYRDNVRQLFVLCHLGEGCDRLPAEDWAEIIWHIHTEIAPVRLCAWGKEVDFARSILCRYNYEGVPHLFDEPREFVDYVASRQESYASFGIAGEVMGGWRAVGCPTLPVLPGDLDHLEILIHQDALRNIVRPARTEMVGFCPEPVEMPPAKLARYGQGGAKSWYYFFGAWGDALTEYGYAQKRGGAPFGIISYWPSSELSRLLAEQDDVAEVIHANPNKKSDFIEVFAKWWSWRDSRSRKVEWLKRILGETGIDYASVDFLAPMHDRFAPICHPDSLKIPLQARERPRELLADVYRLGFRRACVVHPYSLNSNALCDHWSYWNEAWNWMASEFPETAFLLTGNRPGIYIDWKRHPNTIDLLGETSMLELLALCEEAGSIVTTSNSLSLWGVTQHIPTLTCMNRGIDWEFNYFRRWSESPWNTMLSHSASLDDFKSAFHDRFE